MKKKIRSVICIMIVSMMALSACGSKSTGSNNKASEDSTVAENKENGNSAEGIFDESGVSEEGQFPIVKDRIELTVMVPSSTSIQDITTNDFTQWYEDKTNIKINWIVVPAESLTDKVNISLSSGDMPDIYLDCNITQTQQSVYGSQGAFLPLNDYIEKYGAVYKDIASQINGLNEVMTMSDGKIYALPYVEKCVHCENSSKMWVNKRWLDNLNMEIPTTVEEFENMLIAFKEQDPNGNGIADEIPMLSFEGGWHSDALSGWLSNPFVYTSPDDNYVYLNEGKIELAYMQDGWKDAMKWLNSLYKAGLYYDQSLIMNNDQARQVATAEDGTALVGCFPNGVPSAVPGDAAEQWQDYIAISPIEGEAGRYATYAPYNQINPTKFVITSACKYPEAAFRWGVEQYNKDIWFMKAFGQEGTGWVRITPGEGDIPADAVDLNTGAPSEVATFADGIGWGEEQNYCWRGIGLRCDTPDAPSYRYNQYQIGDYESNMEYRLAFDTRDNMNPYNPDINMCLPLLVYDEVQATEMANSQSVILSYVKETAARFITGDLDAEADWDAYLKELEVKGVKNLKDIYQAAYDAKYK